MSVPFVTPPEPFSGDPFSCLFVIFRPIPGCPGYGADTEGNIWSCITGVWKILGGSTHPGGHRKHQLRPGDESYQRYSHRLILETFVGPCPDGMECCHGDGDPANNCLRNLRWASRVANMADRVRHGTFVPPPKFHGERHPMAKLTERKVRQIRALLAAGKRPFEVAPMFGIKVGTIRDIGNRRSWSHVA